MTDRTRNAITLALTLMLASAATAKDAATPASSATATPPSATPGKNAAKAPVAAPPASSAPATTSSAPAKQGPPEATAAPAPATPPDTTIAQTESSLRDILETLKRMKRADSELYAEVNRHQEVVVPDLADAACLNPYAAAPGLWPTGYVNDFETKQGALLPARPQYVNLSMDNLGRLMGMLKSDCAALTAPTSELMTSNDDLKAQAKVLRDTCTAIDTHYNQLLPLTAGPRYDNGAISRGAKGLNDDIEGVNDIRKRLSKMVGHEKK